MKPSLVLHQSVDEVPLAMSGLRPPLVNKSETTQHDILQRISGHTRPIATIVSAPTEAEFFNVQVIRG